MLDLKRTDRNRIVVFDQTTGERKGIYYMTPTSSQMVRYNRKTVQRKRNKLVFDAGDQFIVQIKFGVEIITGFDDFNLKENPDGTYSPIDGDFAFGFDGFPISSDPSSPNYRADWKELLAEAAHSIVALVARVAFAGVRAETDAAEVSLGEEEDEGEDKEPALPLAQS